jgi:hypothetical protein
MPLSGGAEGRTVWRGGLSKTGTSSGLPDGASIPETPNTIREDGLRSHKHVVSGESSFYTTKKRSGFRHDMDVGE